MAFPLAVSEYPFQGACPNCRAQISTRTVPKNGLLTWLLCVGLTLIGCFIGCNCIPFCIDSCKDVEHFCPNCNSLLGKYKRL